MRIPMRLGIRTVAPIFLLSLAWSASEPARAQPACDVLDNGYVGIYADPNGQQPCLEAQARTPTTLYVFATLQGLTASGITFAEFRIEVRDPTGWLFTWAANPYLAVVIGSPLDLQPWNPTNQSGVVMGFATCQTAGKVFLGTITATDVNGTAYTTDLLVKQRTPPSYSTLAAPLFCLCDSPYYTPVTMTPTETQLGYEPVAFSTAINSPLCAPCSSPPYSVPVQGSTWSGVKNIFR